MEAMITEMKCLSLSPVTLEQKNNIELYKEWLSACDNKTLIRNAGVIFRKYSPYDEIDNVDKIKLVMILNKLGKNGFDISTPLTALS